jgi:osmotically-inducible protein OsmY
MGFSDWIIHMKRKVDRDVITIFLSMKKTKGASMPTRLTLAVFILTSLAGPVHAEQSSTINLAENSLVENTHQNERDKGNTTLTPEDQLESKADINITAHIRKAVYKNKDLSVNAQNIKIITRNGLVTLRGPVETEAEKMKVQQVVQHTQGVVQVDNQLEIKAP